MVMPVVSAAAPAVATLIVMVFAAALMTPMKHWAADSAGVHCWPSVI
jgi:hypothetical protein